MTQNNTRVILWGIFLLLVAWYIYRRRRGSLTSHGTAHWADWWTLRRAGMFRGGLIIGRYGKRLLYLPRYTHVLVMGTTVAGKSVSLVVPNLLKYNRGSIFCFDVKGDLFKLTGAHREKMGQKVVVLAPFLGQGGFNPLDTIPSDSPLLIDYARAMAEALVVRTGQEKDPHWNDKAAQIITAVLVYVLIGFPEKERHLGSVQDIVSSPSDLLKLAAKLEEKGGVFARMGGQVKGIFGTQNGVFSLTTEGASVVSTATKHLAFLDSIPVTQFVSKSSFNLTDLLNTGTTVFFHLPPNQLEAQKGLLRCLTSTFIRVLGEMGDETKGEMLFILDEASALGSLSALKEALVRGRSAGIRIMLAYQSTSQVESAFPEEKTLIYDNTDTHIYLGAASIETAQRISTSLGEFTQVVGSSGQNSGRSRQMNRFEGGSESSGASVNYSLAGRQLMKPDEVLRMSKDYLIAFVRGMPAIYARRIQWYQEAEFTGIKNRSRKWLWFALAVLAVGAFLWLRR